MCEIAKNAECDERRRENCEPCAQGLNHRQFQQLLLEMDAEYGDLLYCCVVRWLSRGAMLRRVYQLRNELSAFVAQ